MQKRKTTSSNPVSVLGCPLPAFPCLPTVSCGYPCPTLRKRFQSHELISSRRHRYPLAKTETPISPPPTPRKSNNSKSRGGRGGVQASSTYYVAQSTAVVSETSRCQETSKDEPASPPAPSSRGTSRPSTRASTRQWFPKTRAPPRRSRSACRCLLRRRGRTCASPTRGPPPVDGVFILGDDDDDDDER